MCNILIILQEQEDKSMTEKNLETIKNFNALSYHRNSDGMGIYCSSDNLLVKQKQIIDLNDYKESILKSPVNIFHYRLATSGLTDEYLHPFYIGERYIVVHNGVMHFKGVKSSVSESDTAIFCRLLEQELVKKKMKAAIEEIFNNYYNYGSYSIGIYDIKKKILYYFKDSMTSIRTSLIGDMFLIHTNSEYDRYLTIKPGKLSLAHSTLYTFYYIDNHIYYSSNQLSIKASSYTVYPDYRSYNSYEKNKDGFFVPSKDKVTKQTVIDWIDELNKKKHGVDPDQLTEQEWRDYGGYD